MIGCGVERGAGVQGDFGSLIPGFESVPSLGRRQSRGRPGVSGLGVLCLRFPGTHRAAFLGQLALWDRSLGRDLAEQRHLACMTN